jgi:cell division protease FtsH
MKIKALKILLLVTLIALLGQLLVALFDQMMDEKIVKDISYSEFKELIVENEFEEVTILEKMNTQMQLVANLRNNNDVIYKTYLPNRDSIFSEVTLLMDQNNIKYLFTDKDEGSFIGNLLISLLPITIVCILLYYMMKKSGGAGGGGGIFKMFKHKATMVKSNTKFTDIAGNQETIIEVKEIVDFLANPDKYKSLGAKIPKGVLMVGAPGTGKTLFAKAVAGEANVPFFNVAGSDFVEVFAGLGAGRVRDLFNDARSHAPCIIFIDEIDAVGKKRSSGNMGGNDEREQTLNQLLVEMDGIIGSDLPIIIMAATNRQEILDSALTRPGRFDRIVNIGLPDVLSREKILLIHSANIKVDPNFNFKKIAKSTVGFSGADLANLCNEAALMAGRKNAPFISKEYFEEAIDKILMGVKQQGIQMDEKEKSLTAYHESGHAIIGYLQHKQKLHDPVHKVSIIPRGRALGVTVYQPEKDRVSLNKSEIKANITSLYGGRIAEELIFGTDFVTTGASNDLDRATQYAYNYVTQWGLSELGPIYYNSHKIHIDGRERTIPTSTQEKVEAEITDILNTCYICGVELIKDNLDKLKIMHDALMEYETIDSEDVVAIMEGTYKFLPEVDSKEDIKYI